MTIEEKLACTESQLKDILAHECHSSDPKKAEKEWEKKQKAQRYLDELRTYKNVPTAYPTDARIVDRRTYKSLRKSDICIAEGEFIKVITVCRFPSNHYDYYICFYPIGKL